MGYGNYVLESQSTRWCYSTEEYNERQNDQRITIEEKINPERFYLPFRDGCKENIETLKKTFVRINPHVKSQYHVLFVRMYTLLIITGMNITLHVHVLRKIYYECYVKFDTIPCFDCKNIFLKTSFSGRCSLCYTLIKQKLKNYDPKELRNLANKYKRKR